MKKGGRFAKSGRLLRIILSSNQIEHIIENGIGTLMSGC